MVDDTREPRELRALASSKRRLAVAASLALSAASLASLASTSRASSTSRSSDEIDEERRGDEYAGKSEPVTSMGTVERIESDAMLITGTANCGPDPDEMVIAGVDELTTLISLSLDAIEIAISTLTLVS